MSVSARGLFHATGKRSINTEQRPRLERSAHDFYPTPPEPTRALLQAERDRLGSFPLIWEAACGDGAMMRDIRADGHKCVGSDIIDRGCGAVIKNFFDFSAPLSSAIVTNPPFDTINWRDGRGRWLTHAMATLGVEYMALLLSWNWPAAGSLGPIWAAHPPARVYLMRWKIDFTGQGAPPMTHAWFVWDRAWEGETVLRMLDRAKPASQGEMQ